MVRTETGAVRSELYSNPNKSPHPPRFDLLPYEGLRRWAERFGLGAEKYGDENFRHGFTDKVLLQHAMTHLLRYMDGDYSEDNLGGVLWNIGLLCQMERDKPELMVLKQEIERARLQHCNSVDKTANSVL